MNSLVEKKLNFMHLIDVLLEEFGNSNAPTYSKSQLIQFGLRYLLDLSEAEFLATVGCNFSTFVEKLNRYLVSSGVPQGEDIYLFEEADIRERFRSIWFSDSEALSVSGVSFFVNIFERIPLSEHIVIGYCCKMFGNGYHAEKYVKYFSMKG